MKKLKGLAVLMLLLTFVGCSMYNDAETLTASKETVSTNRGTTSLPATKTVTVTGDVETLRMLPEHINSTLNAIYSGSRSYFYNDANYSGTIKSTNFNVVSAPYKDGKVMVFKIRVTYSGKVNLKIPASKKVSQVKKEEIIRVKPRNISATFAAIEKGSRRIYYRDSQYAGNIYSTSFKVVTAPKPDGEYLIFKMDITYEGTVYRR